MRGTGISITRMDTRSETDDLRCHSKADGLRFAKRFDSTGRSLCGTELVHGDFSAERLADQRRRIFGNTTLYRRKQRRTGTMRLART